MAVCIASAHLFFINDFGYFGGVGCGIEAQALGTFQITLIRDMATNKIKRVRNHCIYFISRRQLKFEIRNYLLACGFKLWLS